MCKNFIYIKELEDFRKITSKFIISRYKME